MLGKTLLDQLGPLKEDSELLPDDWICGECSTSAICPQNTGCNNHKYASARDEASDYTRKTPEEDGACLAKCRLEKYNELITSKYDGMKKLLNLPPLVLKTRHISGSACLSRQWDDNPFGFGLIAEDKPSEFS